MGNWNPFKNNGGDSLGKHMKEGGGMQTLKAATEAQTPPPSVEDPAEQKRRNDEMEASAAEQRRSRGRASTILTGSTGVKGRGAVSSRMLLGS